jgi:hypothetical protein
MSRYKKIDPKFKKVWLKALRTPPDEGGYLQADGTLVKDFSPHYVHPTYTNQDTGLPLPGLSKYEGKSAFCCLGVATNIAIEKGLIDVAWDQEWEVWKTPQDGEWVQGSAQYSDKCTLDTMGLPPKAVADVIGLSAATCSRLASLNDDGESFAAIADWIEEHL